jgi:hypothetical protein
MDKRICNQIFILTTFFAFFVMAGCASTPDGGESADSEAGFSEVAHPFTDVPIPTGFNADRSKSFVYESGSGSIKVGRLYYSGWHGSQDVVNYYQNAMINKGWKMVNAMEHDGMILNYEKKTRVCTVIVTDALLKTHLEIQVGPK